jgi:sterol desaturase/sphingolipid hydroxylase (fatty acid hydroxylase superfamily)
MFTIFAVTAIGLALLIAYELRSAEFVEFLAGPGFRRGLGYIVAGLALTFGLNVLSASIRPLLPTLMPLVDLPLWASAILCVLVAELVNYWLHRLGHGWLWSLHFAHHVEEKYTVLLGAQAHALEVSFRGVIIAVVLPLIGFPVAAVEIYLSFFVLGAWYQHSIHDYSLGWLDWVIVNPAYHRLHHAKTKMCNYGATIVLWDLVFNTYERPLPNVHELEIGIAGWAAPYGFWAEFLYPFRRRARAADPRVTRTPA